MVQHSVTRNCDVKLLRNTQNVLGWYQIRLVFPVGVLATIIQTVYHTMTYNILQLPDINNDGKHTRNHLNELTPSDLANNCEFLKELRHPHMFHMRNTNRKGVVNLRVYLAETVKLRNKRVCGVCKTYNGFVG